MMYVEHLGTVRSPGTKLRVVAEELSELALELDALKGRMWMNTKKSSAS